MNWSKAQLEALSPSDGNMLISAGAGSGKTQVLSQKVHDILASGKAEPESILVVTFTVAAAFEMKQRIKKNLAENGVSEDIINKIDSSHIQTFDSFANFLVRKYASYLNISDTLNILDQNILSIKIHEYVDEIVTSLYDKKEENFINLLKKTCIKSDKPLKELLMDLYKRFDIFEDKDEILNNYENLFFNRDKVTKDYFEFVKFTKKILKDGYETIFTCNFIEDSDRLGRVNEYINNLLDTPEEDFYDAIKNISFPTAKRGTSEEAKKPFDRFKETVKDDIIKSLEPYSDMEKSIDRIFDIKDEILLVIDLIKQLDQKIENYKKLTNSYTFNDIAKMSLKLFDIPELKEKIRNSFKFILVDEYQDTSDIQERFINHISNNNVYMVGDIKQSIYRFRFANCDIFRDKYFLYKADPKKGTKVDLVDNFRSRSQILSTVNEIFSKIMTKEMGGADYKVDHVINYGLKDYDKNIFDENLYGVKLLTYTDEEKKVTSDIEIRIMANKIIELFNNKTQVFDKSGKLRPINFSDIAILVRRKTEFNNYVKVFSDYNIPVSCNTKNSYADYDSILVLVSIITGVNYFRNSYDDEYVLKFVYTSIARSYLFSYSDETIYHALKDGTYKNDVILEKCSSSAAFSLENSIEETFNYVINTFGIIKNMANIESVTQNFDKIEFLNGMSRNFDNSKLTFDDFADFFFKLKEYNLDFEIESLDQTKNAVQLMSNHKSKGLEWPIVFLTDISKQYYGVPDKSNGRFNKLGGAYFNTYGGNQVVPFYHEYNNLINKYEESSEAIRVFYVALTRARETLYMVSNIDKYDSMTIPIIKDRNFLNILKNSCVEIKTEKGNYDENYLEGYNLVLDLDEEKSQIVEFCRVFDEKIKRTASHAVDKNEITDALQARLDFGIELHEYMETIDFKNPSTDHIINPKVKNIVDKILNIDVFKQCSNGKLVDAYKEYEFIDDNLHGFVDLFLLFEDEIKIIDYKLKNIDKPEYVSQLRTYKEYLEKVFKKRCKTYLISLVDARIEEITHE